MRTVQLVVANIILSVLAVSANAAIIIDDVSATNWSPTNNLASLPDLTLTLTGLDPSPVSDLLVTFRLRADVNSPTEFATMSIDGYSFGIWLNDNIADDTISGPVNDTGNQLNSILTGTATIPLATFAILVADGQLSALFDFSTSVGDFSGTGGEEFAEFSISYTTADIAPVPEPASLAIWGALGIAGLVAARRRKKLAAA